MNKLIKIHNNLAVYLTASNHIITEPIDIEAGTILNWYNKNIPANN